MTDRQKFWLKVALFVTFPLWVMPAAIGMIVFMLGLLTWEAVSAIMEPRKCHGRGAGR